MTTATSRVSTFRKSEKKIVQDKNEAKLLISKSEKNGASSLEVGCVEVAKSQILELEQVGKTRIKKGKSCNLLRNVLYHHQDSSNPAWRCLSGVA